MINFKKINDMKKQYFKLKEDGGFVVETNNGNINADGTQIVIKGDFTISAKDVSYLIALLNNKENIINKNMYSYFNEGYNGYRVVTLDDSKLDKFMKQIITNICQKEEIIKKLIEKIEKYNKTFIGKLFPIDMKNIF